MVHPKFLVTHHKETVLCANAAKVETAILGKPSGFTQVYVLVPVSMELLQQQGSVRRFIQQLEKME
ncbi:hypothetical protein EON83_11155 [bacterium]|nr:MAG: hypothetical protein EON83_11155 [bacterium]